MEYTKGEWTTTPFQVVADGQAIADCVLGIQRQPKMTSTELRANIRLITAAPDLYEACKEALKALTPWTDYKTQEANITLQKAIKKAEGK